MTVQTRNPTALDASSGTWDATTYSVVADYPDSASNYLTHGTTAGNATWTVSAPTVPTGATGISVAIKFYAKKTASPGSTMGGRIKIGSSYYDGSQQAMTTSAALYTATWATNPATSAAWTAAEANSIAAAGVVSTDASPTIYVYSVQLQVTYTIDYTLTCDYGSFALTGQTTGLLAGRLLSCEQGTANMTGQDTGLLAGRLLSCEQGSIALSGQDAGLSAGRALSCEQGSIALSGQDVTLTYHGAGPTYTLSCEAGSFTASGQEAGLLVGRKITCDMGMYNLITNSLEAAVVALGFEAYFPLDETSGTVARNVGTLGVAANGAYNGVTLNQIDAPGGGRAGLFDGINDKVNVLTAALSGAINLNLFTVCIWLKVYDASVLTDGKLRSSICLYTDGDNQSNNWKNTTNNTIFGNFIAGGTNKSVTYSSLTADWTLCTITVDVSGNAMKYYINDSQTGTTQTGLGTWVGALLATYGANLGQYGASTSYNWYGYLSHAAITTDVVTAEQIAGVYAAGQEPAWTTLTVHRRLTAEQGTYTLTGQDVTLTYTGGGPTYTLGMDAGSFTLSGQDSGLIAHRTFALDQGAYTLTGQDVGLLAGRALSCEQGAYTLSGQDVGLLAGRMITCDQGSYTLSGQVVTLDYSERKIPANVSGGTTTPGVASGATYGRAVAGSTAKYGVTGGTQKHG